MVLKEKIASSEVFLEAAEVELVSECVGVDFAVPAHDAALEAATRLVRHQRNEKHSRSLVVGLGEDGESVVDGGVGDVRHRGGVHDGGVEVEGGEAALEGGDGFEVGVERE